MTLTSSLGSICNRPTASNSFELSCAHTPSERSLQHEVFQCHAATVLNVHINTSAKCAIITQGHLGESRHTEAMAKNLRKLRQAAGLTQGDLAKKAGLERSMITKAEKLSLIHI